MSRFVEPASWTLPTPASASGCFETMRACQGKIFRLEAHLDRLYASLNCLGIRMPLTPRQLAKRLVRALKASTLREAVVRIALLPDATREASTSIVVQPARPLPASWYQRGIRIAIVPTRKFSVRQIDPPAHSPLPPPAALHHGPEARL